jgi:colicin import membrane protein
MNDNTPPVIPEEPSSWKGTVLSVILHAALFGAIWWVAAGHGSSKQPAKNDNAASAVSQASAAASAAASLPVPGKAAVANAQPDTPAVQPAATAEKTDAPASNLIAKQEAQAAQPAAKGTEQAQAAASDENSKPAVKKEKKKKKHEKELALAKKRAKQKAEALALQKKQKEKAAQAEQVAKKHAADNAIKMAAEAQKRKEQEDQQTLERLHQEEMRRITSGLSGNG